MKVIHITPVFRPYRAGIVNVVYHQARELAVRGYEVIVLTPQYSAGWLEVDQLEGIEVRRLRPLLKYGNAAFVPSIRQELAKLCREMPSPVIHLHTPFFGGQEVIWFVRKLRHMYGARLVVQYHHDAQFNWLTRFLRLPSVLTFRSLIKSADRVLVSSLDYAKNSYIARLVNERFLEVPLGVELQRFKAKYNSAKMKLNEPLKLVIVSALDHAHHFKGIDVLLQALAHLEPGTAELTVIGKGELKEYYESLAKRFNLTDAVKFLGFIPDEELSAHHRAADMFVFPSTGRAEAFGLVAIEAMASGLPVLASDLPGVRTLIQNKEFLVKPDNLVSLAEKIIWASQNMKLLRKTGRANRRLVEQKYTWPKIVDELEIIYRDVQV